MSTISTRLQTPKRLAVLIPDRLSVLAAKGETLERYYNPDNVFDEVHLIMTNDDRVDDEKLQPLVGNARLFVHNLPTSPYLVLQTFGFREKLLKPWVRQGLNLLNDISPQLVRVHFGIQEGYLASQYKLLCGIPYVVSLHGVWDRDRFFHSSFLDCIFKGLIKSIHKTAMSQSDAVIGVYKPTIRYAKKFGAHNVHLIYNVISSNILQKQNYDLSRPARILTVNRQIKDKNPENIIRAIRHLNCHYDLVGQGPLNESLRDLVRELGLESRVKFIPSLPNSTLIERLPQYDLAAFHCDYWGISKGILEASLAGIPIVTNKHPVEPIPDYAGSWMIECDNTEDGYREAIGSLLDDRSKREFLGRSAHAHAMANWDPVKMEKAVANLYTGLVETR